VKRLTRFSYGAMNAGGRMVLDDQAEFRALMGMMADGARLLVHVREDFDIRPDWLNRFYWGFVINPTAEAYGNTPNEMHRIWKQEFLALNDPDQDRRIVLSTARISEERMRRYVEDIRFAAGVDGCKVPEVNEHLEEAA
jgi:hypothetical protein